MAEMTVWQKCLRWAQGMAGLVLRPTTLGVRAIALDAQGRVFLVRHSYTPGFHLPGGGVERRETALAAMLRELAEEGHIATSEPPRVIGFHYNARHSPRDHVVLFLARNVRQTADRAPDWEIVKSGFYPLDALPEDTTPATRARLNEFLHGAPPDPNW